MTISRVSQRSDSPLRIARHPATAWAVSLIALAAATAAMLPVRAQLDKAHVALVYVLIVLLGSSLGGRVLGLTVSALAFLSFDWAFLPPYNTLLVANPLDWLVLAVFLITSVVAAQLLARAQRSTAQALARTADVERLAALGAETLNAARPEAALAAIAEVIRSTLGVDSCQVYAFSAPGHAPSLVAHAGPQQVVTASTTERGDTDSQTLYSWASEQGSVTVERLDGTISVTSARDATPHDHIVPWAIMESARVITIPLRVRTENVGALRITNERGIELAVMQREFLDALSYYAALGAERVRLTADASRAEAFREADHLKNALLAAVSHDLRTPLTTMKALAHTIVERGADPGDVAATSIEEEVDRLTALVTDLLDLSRLTGGAIQFSPAINTADDLVGAALQRTAGIVSGRELRVYTDDGGNNETVLAAQFDFVHSLRVLVNLIENAVKYSPQSSVVEVHVSCEADKLLISVLDRGLGVPVSERARIFEPFYRAPHLPADTRGAGLGLAIARGLATGQGGELRYEPRDGGGSRFVFVLPDAQALLPTPDSAAVVSSDRTLTNF
ncbi:MAG: DUF4118 domain-containing protein [Gemmatimonadota bacterium]|nr:DUF4118 domain-containing protein [Gemmatimonadota bacterium]